jgi:hypothetical protein
MVIYRISRPLGNATPAVIFFAEKIRSELEGGKTPGPWGWQNSWSMGVAELLVAW